MSMRIARRPGLEDRIRCGDLLAKARAAAVRAVEGYGDPAPALARYGRSARGDESRLGRAGHCLIRR
jgi:hypothetical protein